MVEEVIHLLATEYGNDTDDGLENWTAQGGFYERHPDKDGPPPLPQIPVANAIFMERFTIAIESCGWHPDFFAASFRDDESAMLVTQANEAGKTALHWALAHYGYFTHFSGRTPGLETNSSGITSGYAKLAVKLIKKGSDLHSCWHRPALFGISLKASPLISFLQGLGPYRRWIAAELSGAVYQWGKILAEAGISLQKYAATENLFLRANRGAIYVLDGQEFIVAELGVLEQDRLTIRVEPACEVRIWKAMPTRVPGEWPVSPSLPSPNNWLPEVPDTIIWVPEDHDECEGYRWVVVGNVSITTPSYLVEPPGTTENHGADSIDVTPPPRWDEYERPLYDDDFSVMTMEKDEEFRRRTHAYTRRRSASAPAVESSKRVGRHMLYFPGPWRGSVHRCAVDKRWKLSSIACPSVRDCLQGRCRDRTKEHPDRGGTWETWLMKHEDHTQVAKHFAQRFCPQHLDMVETTLARVTERAQLAMGPARPPAASW